MLKPGDALRDDEDVAAAEREERNATKAKAAVEEAAKEHRCNSCLHLPICAVASAIRVLGAEGLIVISKCGAAAPFDVVPEPGALAG
jgi:hypothetical protein